MVVRKALIIGSPDEKIPGVLVDVKNLVGYLKSAVGGVWVDSEIKTLISPTISETRKCIQSLKSSDYSLVFFAGHGYHSIQRSRTILNINSIEELDSVELRVGASKHTLILDCCRKPQLEKRLLKSAMESMTFDAASRQRLNPKHCREFYDKRIAECESGIVVMNSCSINETAGESSSSGGYYTSSLIESSEAWAKEKLASIDLTSKYCISSTQDRHNAASVQVKELSGGRQNPTFESPRSEMKFPFAIVA